MTYVKPTPTHGFRRDIEGLRALAVALVVLYHAGVPGVSGGYVGVDVFFVLSGYLITGILAREIEQTGTISLTRFYAKRARRLLPASFTVLSFVGLVLYIVPRWLPSLVLPQIYGRSISWDIQRSALYVVNWLYAERSVSYQGSSDAASPVLHFWSLSVEEQFYAFWPLLLLGVAVIAKRSRFALIAVIALVTAASLIWSIRLTSIAPDRAYFVTTTRVWEMSLGGLAALVSTRRSPLVLRERWHERVGRASPVLGLSVIIISAFVFDDSTAYPGYAALVPTIATVVLLRSRVLQANVESTRLGSVLSARPMQWVGARSYSIYLWHWPVLWLAVAVNGPLTWPVGLLAVAISVVPAMLSYSFIETPLRSSGNSPLAIWPTLLGAGAVSLAGFGIGFVLLTSTTGIVRTPETPEPVTEVAGVQLVAEQVQPEAGSLRYDVPLGYSNGCFETLHSTRYTECVAGDASSEQSIILIGNSHLAHWAPAIDSLASEHGWRLIYVQHDGCRIAESEGQSEACGQWLANAMDRLPELVDEEDAALVLTGPPPPAIESQPEELRELYDPAFRALGESGTPAAMFMPVPRGKIVGVDCSTTLRGDLSACATDRTSAMIHGQVLADSAQSAGVATLDLTDYFCDATHCPAVIDSLWVRRDEAHLTRTFALALTTAIEGELRRVAPALFE